VTKIEVSGDELVVHVQGLDKLLAFKSELRIPLSHIEGSHVPTMSCVSGRVGARWERQFLAFGPARFTQTTAGHFGTSPAATRRSRSICAVITSVNW